MTSIFKISNIYLFLLVAIIVACQATVYEKGKYIADPESRITLLEGGPHSGSLKNQDLYLQYQYVHNPDRMLISGFIELSGRLSGNYEIVRFFYLTVNFLDNDGLLLQRKRVFNAGRVDRIDLRWRFQRNLETPPETAAIAFSYTGEVREGEPDSVIGFTGVEPFYLNPLRRVPSP